MMKFKLIVILALAITEAFEAFSQDYNSRYNFGFETDRSEIPDNWQLEPDSYTIKFDTIDKVEGKRSIVFTRSRLESEFNLCLFQKFLLPKPADQISVSVFSKNIDHQNSWLKIAGFDKLGKIIVSDSLSIISNFWKEFTAQIMHKDIYLLSIEIRTKHEFKERNGEVKLWVDGISVRCDGKNLLSFDPPSNESSGRELAAIKNNIPLNEDMVLPEYILKDIAKKKIIGFGETAHGSFEIDKCKYNNIKQLVLSYNCRLVLFEMPIDLVSNYNLYVHGYEIDSTYLKSYPWKTKIDTTYEKLSFLSSEQERFMNWLKDFNATHDEKVNIVGIDTHTQRNSQNDIPLYLNRYITSMRLKSEKVDSLLILITNGGWSRYPLRYAQKNEKPLTDLMGSFNYMVLLNTLKSRTDSVFCISKYKNRWSNWHMDYRDYIMWQNTKQVLENFTDGKSPVVVCAHYAHLDKISPIHFNEVVTLGQYITKVYGNDFIHFGILLGQGEAGTRDEQKKKVEYQELQLPVKGSLEYLASQTNQECFYKAGDINTKIPLLIRRSGGVFSKTQFIPAYFPGSMDGFIYIQTSTPSFKL